MHTDRIGHAVDAAYDHILGSPKAELTLVEDGSYACPPATAQPMMSAEISLDASPTN